eukprot:Sspe_Gene.52299::Locus_28977_Transcript_3_3_Confidence_0.600_Length_1316::g.52299::m.52299
MSDTEHKGSPPESDSEEVEALMTRPVKVEYCPECTFPAEYCEFSGKLEACKKWLEVQAAKEGMEGLEVDGLEEKGKVKKKMADDVEKELPGGKKKKKAAQEVVVGVSKRGGRKYITSVKGMDLFGHKLDDLAREFKKKFSSGAAVVSNPGQPDSIDIQGDFLDAVLEQLPKKWHIPKDAIYKMDDKVKVKVEY